MSLIGILWLLDFFYIGLTSFGICNWGRTCWSSIFVSSFKFQWSHHIRIFNLNQENTSPPPSWPHPFPKEFIHRSTSSPLPKHFKLTTAKLYLNSQTNKKINQHIMVRTKSPPIMDWCSHLHRLQQLHKFSHSSPNGQRWSIIPYNHSRSIVILMAVMTWQDPVGGLNRWMK